MAAFKRIVSFLLAFVLLIGTIPVNAAANELEPTVTTEATTAPTEEPTAPSEEPTATTEEPTAPSEEPTAPTEEPTAPSDAPTEPALRYFETHFSTGEGPTAEEQYEGYVNQVFFSQGISLYASAAGDTLTGDVKVIYDAVAPIIRQIANGQRASAAITVGQPVTYNGADYPVDVEAVFTGSEFTQAMLHQVMSALLADLPYECYWFDKVTGVRSGGFSGDTLTQITLSFTVGQNYRGADQYTADTAKTSVAKTSADNAKRIVDRYASYGDREKLTAYRDEICALVSYDHSAASGNVFQTDIDPWQLISVFDGSTDTNVVCEGYSKAFMYLCDMSSFSGGTACYTVSGDMDGGAHMWNIVTMGGKNYLVDVTNSDSGTIGQDGRLFLVTGTGSAADGYTVANISYIYDSDTIALWGTGTNSILTLAAEESTEPEGVEVNEENFPDDNFRSFILEQDYGMDGVLTEEELTFATEINVSNLGISSLKGIEHFTALTTLYCSDNLLTSLDVSKNTALTYLDCDINQLAALDVSNNTALTYLDCYKNQLTALDVSKNLTLTYLICNSNQLTSLDVSKNTALEYLTCSYNSRAITVDAKNQFDLSTLPGFDVTKASNWVGGTVSGNILTATAETITYTYDLGNSMTATFTLTTTLNELAPEGVEVNEENFPDANFRAYILEQDYGMDGLLTQEELAYVTYIEVRERGITDLTGIAHFAALTYLDCAWNQLTALDVSNNTALTHLDCGSNQLTALDVSNNTALKYLSCYGNQPTALDVTSNTALVDLSCSTNLLTTLDVTNNTALTYLNCASNQLTALDVSNNTALTELWCGSNQLFTLDVTKNTALTGLWCGSNQLSTLDVSNNTALMILNCGSNQLTTLDVSQNTALEALHCSSNQLTALDVSQNMALTSLTCRENQLTSLDVSKHDNLFGDFDCRENSRAITVDANNQFDLSTLPGFDVTRASDWVGGTVEGTTLTATDTTIAYSYQIRSGTKVTFTLTNTLNGETPGGVLVNEENFPDAAFRSYILSQSYGKDGLLTKGELAAVTEILLQNQEITDLSGIEYFTGLKHLICSGIPLKTLDVSSNLELTDLICMGSQLTELDIRNNTKLASLTCGGSPLSELDLSQNTELESLSCVNCQLQTLDVSNNTALTTLHCRGNQLRTLDVRNNTALRELNCDSNQLAELDLSCNANLRSLSCNSNQLRALDVSKNTLLIELRCSDNQLTTLDVIKNADLDILDCSDNQLTSLDVSHITELGVLRCSGNLLTSLDVSTQLLLNEVTCNENSRAITVDTSNQFDLSTLPGFDAGKASNWKGGTVSDTTLTATAETITYTYDLGNSMTATFTLTTTLNEPAPDGVEVNEENFPDANFRSFILEEEYGIDRILTQEELAEITQIIVPNMGIASLAGIEHFTALTTLHCSHNQLQTLDVSRNAALTELNCANNMLTSLDVSKNPALKKLRCASNQLTELNISTAALTELECHSNQLSALDVSRNPALTKLDCANNRLTALDVTGNSALTVLDCENNQLNILDLRQNAALKEVCCAGNRLTTMDMSGNPALTYLDCYNNDLSILDVNWNSELTSLRCYGNQLDYLYVNQNPALTTLDCSGNTLQALTLGGNTKLAWLYCNDNQLTELDLSGCTALQGLFCQNNLLSELNVSSNSALLWLQCGSNQLTSLDLSKNPGCAEIDASGNGKQISVDETNEFNLATLPGFDVTKASNWKGGSVRGYTLAAAADTITYSYCVRDDKTVTFSLNAENYVPRVLKAPVIEVENDPETGKPVISWEEADCAVKYQVYRATSKNGKYTRLVTTTKTSQLNANAVAGKLYYYKVRSVDADGKTSGYSNIVSKRCDLPQPSITVSGVSSSGKIKVSWKKIDGAKSYQVYRATSENGEYTLMKTTTSTSYTNTSAKAGTTYYYKVRALHKTSAANSAYSLVKSRTCDLARPTVTLSGVSSTGKIKVSWKAISGAVSYDIYRATGKNGTYSLLTNVTGTSFTDNETVAGKTYYYRVVAVHSNTAANSAKSTAKNRVCDLARPDVKIELKNKKPRLTWEKVEGATKYEVYRATSKNGKYTLVKTTTGTSFTNTGAKKGTTYYYKVKAIHSNSAANSAYSTIESIKSK